MSNFECILRLFSCSNFRKTEYLEIGILENPYFYNRIKLHSQYCQRTISVCGRTPKGSKNPHQAKADISKNRNRLDPDCDYKGTTFFLISKLFYKKFSLFLHFLCNLLIVNKLQRAKIQIPKTLPLYLYIYKILKHF